MLKEYNFEDPDKITKPKYLISSVGQRFTAALLPRLFGTNPRSHHKGATGRFRTGNQQLPVLCHCQLGQDIPVNIIVLDDLKGSAIALII